jgi:hypothetical protein
MVRKQSVLENLAHGGEISTPRRQREGFELWPRLAKDVSDHV